MLLYGLTGVQEVVRSLHKEHNIEPQFATLVWQKLQEQNTEFFHAYEIRWACQP